jgi:hypothetical protein
MDGMATFLGLLAFALYIVLIISFAAGVTWVVVRFSPTKKPDAAPKT